jgi:hypothetical protein
LPMNSLRRSIRRTRSKYFLRKRRRYRRRESCKGKWKRKKKRKMRKRRRRKRIHQMRRIMTMKKKREKPITSLKTGMKMMMMRGLMKKLEIKVAKKMKMMTTTMRSQMKIYTSNKKENM